MTDTTGRSSKEVLGLVIDKLSQIVNNDRVYMQNNPSDAVPQDTDSFVSTACLNTNESRNQSYNGASTDNSGTRSSGGQTASPSPGNPPAGSKMTFVPVLIVPSVNDDSGVKQFNDAVETTYECSMCDYKSHNKHYLKQHVDLVHVSNRPFKCPFCDYAGKRSQALKEHLVVHSSESPFSCDICSASFRKKGHLTSHIRLHQNMRTFVCNICHTEFPKRKLLYAHLRESHPSQNVYACDVCDYTTTIKSNIIMHMHTHSNPKVYQCSQCDFKAIHVNLLKQHMKQHEPSSGRIVEADVKVLMLKCSECGFCTQSQEILRNHMWSHVDKSTKETTEQVPQQPDMSSVDKSTVSPPRRDLATTSESSTSFTPQLPTMFKTDGSVTVYKCAECSFCSKEAFGFITHMLSHKPRFPKNVNKPLNAENASFVFDGVQQVFRCLICGYACEHQRTIKSHIWKHSGHKKIEYPMFQNGPISLYDSDDDAGLSPSLLPKAKASESESLDQSLPEQPATSTGSNTYTESKGVLLNPRQPAFLPGRILKSPSQSSISSTGSTSEKRSCDDAESFSKRFCKDGPKNVIVEALNDIYVTPRFVYSYSNHSSPRTNDSHGPQLDGNQLINAGTESIQPPVNELSQHQADVPKVKCGTNEQATALEKVSQEHEAELLSCGTSGNDSLKEEAVTLLSLLKKGPNFNPACPTAIPGALKLELPKKRKHDQALSGLVEQTTIKGIQQSSPGKADSVTSDGSKSKSGICSSLLAVIEQLRERATSESDLDEQTSTSSQSSKHARVVFGADPGTDWLSDYPNVEKVEGGEGMFRCKLCHYSNCSQPLMKQHMSVHKSKQPFECSLCDFMADSSEDLQDHMIQHCKARTYQCKTCMANFNYKSQLRAHMRVAHMAQAAVVSSEGFACDECDFVAGKLADFRLHMAECHSAREMEMSITSEQSKSDEKSNKEMFGCHRCDFVCFSHSQLKQHQSAHDDGPIKCKLCDFTAISNRSLKSHMKRHVNDQRYVQQPLEQYKCGLCGYVCHHLPSLKSHMWRHAGDANYQYDVTNNAINAAIDYEVGLRDGDVQLGEEGNGDGRKTKSSVRFRCCQCGYETMDKTVLQEHMLSHVQTSSGSDQN